MLPDCVSDGIEDWNVFVGRPTFSRSDPADDVRSVLNHLLCVKRAFLAGNSLHDETRTFIYQNAQN